MCTTARTTLHSTFSRSSLGEIVLVNPVCRCCRRRRPRGLEQERVIAVAGIEPDAGVEGTLAGLASFGVVQERLHGLDGWRCHARLVLLPDRLDCARVEELAPHFPE